MIGFRARSGESMVRILNDHRSAEIGKYHRCITRISLKIRCGGWLDNWVHYRPWREHDLDGVVVAPMESMRSTRTGVVWVTYISLSNKWALTFCASGRAIHGERMASRIRTAAMGATMTARICLLDPNRTRNPTQNMPRQLPKLTHPHTKPNMNIMTVTRSIQNGDVTAMRGLGWMDA